MKNLKIEQISLDKMKQILNCDIVITLSNMVNFLIDPILTSVFAINSNTRTFRYYLYSSKDRPVKYNYINDIECWSKTYSLKDIRGFEILKNNETISKRSTNFGKAIAGGLLFGGLGAIIGIFSPGGKTKTSTKEQFSIIFKITDIDNPIIKLPCYSYVELQSLITILEIIEEESTK